MPPPKDTFEDRIYTKAVLGNRKLFDKGPQGLGDPSDNSLNDIEWKVAIPGQQREIIIQEYCIKENTEFETCRQENWFFNRFIMCSNAKKQLLECVNCRINDANIREKAISEYLKERSAYRETGLSKWERQHPDYVEEKKSKRWFKSGEAKVVRDASIFELYKNAYRRWRNKSEPESKENG